MGETVDEHVRDGGVQIRVEEWPMNLLNICNGLLEIVAKETSSLGRIVKQIVVEVT